MNESMGKYYDSMYTYYGIYEEELSKEQQADREMFEKLGG